MIIWRYACRVTVCFLALGLLVACNSKMFDVSRAVPEIEDGGFISGEPCGPPCFKGIVPGVTTEAEAIQLLQAEQLYQKCEAYNDSASRGIYCLSGVDATFQQGTDIVEEVGFRLSQTVTVGDVITEYEEPDAVLVAVISKYPRARMVLYYDDLQARLLLTEQTGSTFRVETSTKIEYIAYLSPEAYTFHTPEIDSLPKWNGYGEYQEYIPRN